jgi:hypothetical protein
MVLDVGSLSLPTLSERDSDGSEVGESSVNFVTPYGKLWLSKSIAKSSPRVSCTP